MVLAMVIAGGVGNRMQLEKPKQFLEINGKPLIAYTLKKLQNHSEIDKIAVVCVKGHEQELFKVMEEESITKFLLTTEGGKTQQESIYNGIQSLHDILQDDDVILIHAANRPIISDDIITDSIAKAKEYGNGISAVPVVEGIAVSNNGKVASQILDRNLLYKTHTPQSIIFGQLKDLHALAKNKAIENSVSTATLLVELGKKIYFSMGSEKNIKITYPEDVEIFKAYQKTDVN